MKTKQIILSTLLSFTFLVGCAYSKSFSFTPKEPQWSFYGEGLGSYVSNMGRGTDQTSLWLSTDYGESETAFFTWSDLTPGLYKVSTYVRAEDVQKGPEGASFWHFYDGGQGTESPFTDLNGSYDWRKVEYLIHVKASDLTIWFRLKSAGQVWIDDFTIEKVEAGQDKISIGSATPLLPKLDKTRQQNVKIALQKKLYSFDSNESGHPFSLKNKTGVFTPQKFFNFKISSMPVKDWSPYDRVEMEVYNPNDSYTNFYLTLADNKTTNYWSQVNHKQTLAPGWNKLSFSLTQYVGERGSHRFQRAIDLAKLEKVFIVIDPDSKATFSSKSFLIDNIFLSSNPMPSIPNGVLAFDFTSQKAEKSSNLNRVTTQTAFNEGRGFGFIEPKFWRVEDSKYASEALRYSIGMLDGHFRVKLPNGKYQISLVIDKLGYWDVPFWSDRTVLVGGLPIFKESRSSGLDFLADLLQFEKIVPDLLDNPYDLYLSKIFHSIDKTIEVNNGILDLEFKGDETGISLNSLVIWNKNNDAAGQAYKKAFEKRNKEEFDWMSRSIQKVVGESLTPKLSISVIDPDLYLNPGSLKKGSRADLQFFGGAGDRPYQVVQLNSGNNDEKVSWSFTDFTNERGMKITPDKIEISNLVFQYTSPDINHETYMLAGKYLEPMQDHSYALKKNRTRYLWLQLKMTDKLPKGIFKGELVFHHGSSTTKFPIEVNVLDYTLPKVEFPVGFFGIDPLPYSYTKGSDYQALRKKYRHLAVNKLGEAGFTTFTGLPGDLGDLDELFQESSKWGMQTVYSYGGQFPQTYIDLNNKPSDISEDTYLKKASTELKLLLAKKSWPKIVHTFSDEAGGYSDKVASDLELAIKLKKYFPFMPLGGFGSFHGGDSNKLNSYFDYGFFSSLTRSDVTRLKDSEQRWGLYNASAGNLDDPRFSFGLGLYIARLNGLSQYLEWHATGANNYPYYDFDGRESDVVMFYPTLDGKILHSLRFELATEGLHVYKKLKLIEYAVINNLGPTDAINQAKLWLTNLKREYFFYSSTTFMSQKNINFQSFELKLNEHLKSIFSNKEVTQ